MVQLETEFLTLEQIEQVTGISRSTIKRWRRLGMMSFPEPCKIGGQLRRWERAEIVAWMRSQKR